MEKVQIFSKKSDEVIGDFVVIGLVGGYPRIKLNVLTKNIDKNSFDQLMDSTIEKLSEKYPNMKKRKRLKIELNLSNKVEKIEKNSFKKYKGEIDNVVLKSPKIIKKIEKLDSKPALEGSVVNNQPIPSFKKVLPARVHEKPRIKPKVLHRNLQQNTKKMM